LNTEVDDGETVAAEQQILRQPNRRARLDGSALAEVIFILESHSISRHWCWHWQSGKVN